MIKVDVRLSRPGFALDAAFRSDAGVTALFGPSGSGKSSLIRLIAGLDRPGDGRIVIAGRTVVDTAAGVFVPVHRRRIGLVFQDAQLLPHLDVGSNLTYGRFFAPRSERRIAFDPVVEVLGIGHLLRRRPATLSGGERQRVAIGRALLASPRVLLMDEPLASLDEARKREILPFIEQLRDAFAIPIVYVSHAAEEVNRLAGLVVRIENGRVAAIGTPTEVLLPTALSGDRRFEAVSVVTARVEAHDAVYGVTRLVHPAGSIVVPGRVGVIGAMASVAVGATSVTLARGDGAGLSIRTALSAKVRSIATDDSPFALVTVDLVDGERLGAYVTRLAVDDLRLRAGDAVHALIKAASVDETAVAGDRAAPSP